MSGVVKLTVMDKEGCTIHQEIGNNAIMRTGVRSILESFFGGVRGGLIKRIEFGTDFGLGTKENPTPITPSTADSEFIPEFSYDLEEGSIVQIGMGKYQLTTLITALDFLDVSPVLHLNSIRLVNESGAVFAWKRVEYVEIGVDRTALLEWKFNFGETCEDVQ